MSTSRRNLLSPVDQADRDFLFFLFFSNTKKSCVQIPKISFVTYMLIVQTIVANINTFELLGQKYTNIDFNIKFLFQFSNRNKKDHKSTFFVK